MVGLVYIEPLHLSVLQQAAIAGAMWIYVSGRLTLLRLVFAQAMLLAGFWGVYSTIDSRLLMQSATALHSQTWQQFLSAFAFKDYVRLQPPFFTFWVSRFPSLVWHQVFSSCLAVGCGALLMVRHGDRARIILACPLWALMSVQPSNDLLLFALMLMALRAHALGYRLVASLLWGLAYPIKPLAVLIVPLMARRLGVPMLLSLGLWGVYIRWSFHYYFGLAQWDFLLRQLLVR